MISHEIVTETWQKMSQTPVDQSPALVEQMRDEQPLVLSYLISLDDLPFDQYERELIFYIGMVVWQIMKRSHRQLYKVTRKKLRRAEESNIQLLEELMVGSEGAFIQSVQVLVRNHPEREVLRYIVEAIMESGELDDEPGFRNEGMGLAFIHLKILLDAFVDSLGPRAPLAA